MISVDAALAAELDSELEPHGLQVFASPGELALHGLGYRLAGRCEVLYLTRAGPWVRLSEL